MPRKVRSPLQGICADIVVPNIALSIGRRKRRERPFRANSSAVRQRRREDRVDNSSEAAVSASPDALSDHDQAQAAGPPQDPSAQRLQQHAFMTLDTFICLLRINMQERCIAISSSSKGAQCIATATPKPGSQDTLKVQLHTGLR